MRTYAAIAPAVAIPMFDGGLYARLPETAENGDRLVAPIVGAGFAILFTCGSALEARAIEEAAKYPGGFVVPVDSQYWPGHADIAAALAALSPEGAK